jgi:hypothetical protein
MEHPRGFSAEQKFLRMTFVHAVSGANLGMQQTLWIVTGEAAFLGLIISHIESISKIISSCSLKWGIILLVLSILCGVIAKIIATAVVMIVSLIEQIHKEFNSEQGQLIFSEMKKPIDINDIGEKVSEPFLWPLRGYMKRRFHAGAKDFLNAEKKAVKWLCIYFYFSAAQWFLGLAGIFCFALGIQTNGPN